MSAEQPNSAHQDAELEAMEQQVRYWEKYVEEKQKERQDSAAMVQDIMNVSGLAAKGINPLAPEFAEIALDLEFQRQVSLHYGLKLDKAVPLDTSKPDPSRWRQRTSALKV